MSYNVLAVSIKLFSSPVLNPTDTHDLMICTAFYIAIKQVKAYICSPEEMRVRLDFQVSLMSVGAKWFWSFE